MKNAWNNGLSILDHSHSKVKQNQSHTFHTQLEIALQWNNKSNMYELSFCSFHAIQKLFLVETFESKRKARQMDEGADAGQIALWTQLVTLNYLLIPTTDSTLHLLPLIIRQQKNLFAFCNSFWKKALGRSQLDIATHFFQLWT